ncbi:hypothetical protein FGADI_971 [Fusarium gaditjirri]|uniref:Uncharacterized protein n=1 Tax=Fusarium gaditjirri TaxID=282569 RepID=A0A8H4TM94_9HYPO|nr:hypothetical protein FGADI_971 [Fusarium gaditjirri]
MIDGTDTSAEPDLLSRRGCQLRVSYDQVGIDIWLQESKLGMQISGMAGFLINIMRFAAPERPDLFFDPSIIANGKSYKLGSVCDVSCTQSYDAVDVEELDLSQDAYNFRNRRRLEVLNEMFFSIEQDAVKDSCVLEPILELFEACFWKWPTKADQGLGLVIES